MQTDFIISLPGTSTSSTSISLSNSAILDGTFFCVLPEKSSAMSVVAVCNKCRPKYVEVKVLLHSTSNFRSHLKRRHGMVLKFYVNMKIICKQENRGRHTKC